VLTGFKNLEKNVSVQNTCTLLEFLMVKRMLQAWNVEWLGFREYDLTWNGVLTGFQDLEKNVSVQNTCTLLEFLRVKRMIQAWNVEWLGFRE